MIESSYMDLLGEVILDGTGMLSRSGIRVMFSGVGVVCFRPHSSWKYKVNSSKDQMRGKPSLDDYMACF